MSTLTGEQESRLLESEEELYSFFQPFAKPAAQRQVGIECEFFGIERETGRALPYMGPTGIEAVLCRLAATFHYEPVLEEGHVIALRRGDSWVTLEPGGQVELSAPPVRTIFDIEKQLQEFRFKLLEIKHDFPGITWISVGIHPTSRLDEIPWIPKRRYQVMADYFRSQGPLAHEMMKQTATNQVNLDFTDETNALEQFRLIFLTTSLASAIFAHSSFSEGRPNGFLTRRVHVWNETDPDRCGLLIRFLEEGRGFRDYVEYLLEMPMIFIVRRERWIPMKGTSFRKFLEKGKEGHRATWADFELHLSTAFPEARFKHCLEIRGMDAQRFTLIPSMAAFWKGLLYDGESRRKASGLVCGFSPQEILRLHTHLPQQGLRARLGKVPVLELARELYELSYQGLRRQAYGSGEDECLFLEPLNEEILKPGLSPAETLLKKWEKELGRSPKNLISCLEI